MVIPKCAPRAIGVETPTAAANHFPFGVVGVVRPFPHVSMHVEETPLVRSERPDGHRMTPVVATRLSRERAVAVVVGLCRGEQLTSRIRGDRPGATPVLPFPFGRQTKMPALFAVQ